MAEAQKKITAAKLASVRARVVEAQAAEAFAEAQVKRLQELVRQGAVGVEVVEERRAQWEAAKARRSAAEGEVLEWEGHVALDEARVQVAQLHVERAELVLKQLKSRQ